MSFAFLDSTARATWAAGTSEQGQLEALSGLWVGNVEERIYSAGGTLLTTVLHDGLSINTATDPRRCYLGAYVSEIKSNDGTAAYGILSLPGSTDILRCDVSLAGQILSTNGRTNLADLTPGGLVILATASLPANDDPAWLTTADPAINEWVAISGTSTGVGDVDAFCGWGFRSDTNEIYVIAAGGHTNSGSNAVQKLSLQDNAPAWSEVRATSWNGSDVNVSHYTDGSPAARHTYHTTKWVASLNRFLLVGCPYSKGGNADSFPTVDGFNPTSNAYDAAGTYTEVLRTFEPNGPFGFGVSVDGDGKVWAAHDRRYAPATDTWDYPSVTGRIGGNFPQCYSPTLDVMFGLQWGDGTSGSGLAAYKRAMSTLTDSAITWSAGSSSAVAQFGTDAPVYAGMDWDVANSRFLFYQGGSRVYSIAPDSGTEWDMAILSTTGTPPSAASSGGINSKFTYVEFATMSGFVAMPTAAGGLYFLRTA